MVHSGRFHVFQKQKTQTSEQANKIVTNFYLFVMNLQKEKHKFSKWKHIPVNKDSFYHGTF